MRLINYRCTECDQEIEILEKHGEKKPDEIECPFCGAPSKQFNLKQNIQRWKFFD